MLTDTSLLSTPACRFLVSSALVTVLAAGPGCSDETGLLVEVTRDEQSTPDNIDQLRFFIGTGQVVSFVQDQNALDMIDIADGRDLLDDPYTLLLRDAIDEQRGDQVMVGVIGLAGGQEVAFGRFDEPKEFVDGAVHKWPVVLYGDKSYGLTDTGCLVFDGGEIAPDDDRDCDGDARPADCNDADPDVGPSQPERCENGVDDDCNDEIDEEKDSDGDGVGNCDDCDDTDRLVFPGAKELCDGFDNNCDGKCDVEFDLDGDGYSTCGSKIFDDGESCEEPRQQNVDCEPEDEHSFPGAEDKCDGVDNNCNGVCDDEHDPDLDNFTECGSRIDACNGVRPIDVDCAPGDGAVFPRAPELCDGQDNNCDGERYEAVVDCYAVGVAEGGADVCILGTRTCDDQDGGAGFGDCTVEGRVNDPEFQAPLALCTAYDMCSDADVPDPFDCANAMTAMSLAPCTVNLLDPLEPDELCPGQATFIPAPDAAGCEWSVIGGPVQNHWIVGFHEGDAEPIGEPQPSANSCNVFFRVEASRDTPPSLDSVLIWHRTAANPMKALFEVQLVPATPAACPVPGLQCTGLDVPSM